MKAFYIVLCWCVGLHSSVSVASAADRQSLDDAWWTGPILAANANTLPKGHALIEPYFFNITSRGRYDDNGHRQSGPRRHSYGSLTYINYGLMDNFTVGIIPRFGYNDVSVGEDSSGLQLADFMVQGQYRFTQFREGSRVPTMSLLVSETLPTGKYDRLGSNPNDGLGSGAYTTTVALYSQYFLWMPNGRIMRTRLNLQYSLPDTVSVRDVSVYGTSEGFRGHAKPGRVFLVDSAWEYSMTRKWVLALDATYEHDTRTTLRGNTINVDFGASEVLTFAPAIEYNWSPRMGVIAGMIFTASGHNASANKIPVAAINMVF